MNSTEQFGCEDLHFGIYSWSQASNHFLGFLLSYRYRNKGFPQQKCSISPLCGLQGQEGVHSFSGIEGKSVSGFTSNIWSVPSKILLVHGCLCLHPSFSLWVCVSVQVIVVYIYTFYKDKGTQFQYCLSKPLLSPNSSLPNRVTSLWDKVGTQFNPELELTAGRKALWHLKNYAVSLISLYWLMIHYALMLVWFWK